MSMQQNIYTKEKISLNVARIKKEGINFEVVLSDPEKAYNLRHGKEENIRDIISSEHVFIDAKKGDLSSETELERIFKTTDVIEIAKKIILNGEINLTSEQRKKMNDAKRRKIIQYIHQNSFDPKTKLPHPVQRLENAIEELKISINPEENFDYILKKVVEKLKTVLSISFEKIRLDVRIPQEYAAHAYSVVKTKFSLSSESWGNDGSVSFEILVVGGQKSDLFSLLNKITSGTALIEEIK